MTGKSAIKSISIALGYAGGAIAFPALAPYLAATGAGQVIAGLLDDENLRKKLLEVVPNTISGILTNLASEKVPEIAGALTSDNNHDLEKALAEAISKALDEIARHAPEHEPESERQDLKSEINRCLPYWKRRIKRGIEKPGSLFPPAQAATAESFILASGDPKQTEDLLRNDVVATLRRWLSEEETHKGNTGSTGEFFNPLLPLVRERMPGLIGKHLNQIVKEDAFKHSWIAFQRAHLQSGLAVLRRIEAQNSGISETVTALSARIDSITGNESRLTELADGLGKLFDLLQENESRRDEHLERLSDQINKSEARIIDKVVESKREILDAVQGRISTGPNLHQLPADTSEFTGRTVELDELLSSVRRSGVTITGLKGMGGIGKTWLAVRLAHELKADYPDAQIFLDLHGVSGPDRAGIRRRPLSPEEVMWHVIRSFRPASARPETFEEHLTAYRDCLADKHILLVYDNARDEDQLKPLHPPSNCLLIVTSRQMIDLPGMELKQIDRMKPDDSIALIEKIAPGRAGDLAGKIAELCGYLPLAIRLTASVLKKERLLTANDIVKRLGKPSGRLKWKNLTDIEAAFDLSYDLLNDDLRRCWLMLAVFPETFDHTAAAVWDVEPDQAREICSQLVDGYSLVELDEKADRLRLHDLAMDFALDRIPEADLEIARSLHSRHYQHVLSIADDLFESGDTGVVSGLALFDLESRNIIEGHDRAASGIDDEVARLAVDYPGRGINVINLRLHPRVLIEWHLKALNASRTLKSRTDEAISLGNLGNAYAALGEVRKAIENYEAALLISREIGDRRGEGNRLGNLGLAYADLGEVRKAIENYEAALEIFEAIESPNAEVVKGWLEKIKNVESE